MGPSRRLPMVLAVTLLCWPLAAHGADSWIEVRSPHFTVASNAGEKEARRIANQFEEIRAVFNNFFPTLHVDPGTPLTVIALKNEDSMKTFLPDYWVGKDRARPAGMYVTTLDENFAVLRTDVSGSAENPYHALYHEYTHGIMALNFSALPTWLNEGLAEFYGNTVVNENEVDIGPISSLQLRLLQTSSLIPIATLMNADQRSPLYNERDRASIFYAESWAIVHYLLMDPDAVKQQYFGHYLKAWEETRDGEEAARRAFGDLKKFESKINGYARQTSFYYRHGKPQAHFSPKDYNSRVLTPAEAMVVQANFLQHTGHVNEARKLLTQALGMQPDLASIHESLGYDNYTQFNNDEAEREFRKAADLNSQDFRPFFYLARIAMRKGYRSGDIPQIVGDLEKAVQLNPNFAPGYDLLSVAYCQQPETRQKALDAAVKANHLEPAVLTHIAEAGEAYIALGRDAEARAISATLNKEAISPDEKAMAQSFARRLERWEGRKQNGEAGAQIAEADEALDAPDTAQAPVQGPKPVVAAKTVLQAVATEEGVIRDADCNTPPGAWIKLAILGQTLTLSVPNVANVEYRSTGKPIAAGAIPCSQWKGRKARITFKTSSGETSQGDVTSIDFF